MISSGYILPALLNYRLKVKCLDWNMAIELYGYIC